jgi:hypothetical protein
MAICPTCFLIFCACPSSSSAQLNPAQPSPAYELRKRLSRLNVLSNNHLGSLMLLMFVPLQAALRLSD